MNFRVCQQHFNLLSYFFLLLFLGGFVGGGGCLGVVMPRGKRVIPEMVSSISGDTCFVFLPYIDYPQQLAE